MTELVTLNNPNFLFGFYDEQNLSWKYAILSDVSLFPCRFNEFIVSESLHLFPKIGFYTFKVWEQESAVNLDPENAGALVEEGRLTVWNNDETLNTYQNEEKSVTYGDE